MDEYNDKPQFDVVERSELPAIIKVIGVGGGGGNAVENMFKTGIKDVTFVLCNTDKQAMRGTKIPRTLLLGPGRGAGGDPLVARQLAEESVERIKELLDANNIVSNINEI